MKAKTVLGRLLMTFVVFSIGYASGKEMTLRAIAGNPDGVQETAAGASSEQTSQEETRVLVYYMHATFRCVSCNSIEAMAKEVVENDFGEALADNRLEWRTVNFQENIALGRRYGVGTSTLVVVKISNGKEVDFRRLDGVWMKLGDPNAFKKYVNDTIREFLEGGQV